MTVHLLIYCHKYDTNSFPPQAVGSEGETLPDHVGIPLGEEHGGATYFMLETHYDNPTRHQNVVDHSGLRIFYTDKLRDEHVLLHTSIMSFLLLRRLLACETPPRLTCVSFVDPAGNSTRGCCSWDRR